MFRTIQHLTKYNYGFKDMKKAFYDFLNFEAGAVYRGAPQFRERRYKNIEISEKFKEMEKTRKEERLRLVNKRKEILQKKLTNKTKLLTQLETAELESLNQESKSLETIIEEQNKELEHIEQNLEETEAEYILLEGMKKLIVLNQITYLKHMNQHNVGVKLNPESVDVIENIHYLAIHNLPVLRYVTICLEPPLEKLYEVMPTLFVAEIGELDEAAMAIIIEKNLNMFEETDSVIKGFSAREARAKITNPRDLGTLKNQKEQMFEYVSVESTNLMHKHTELINEIESGKTVFRNVEHAHCCLVSTKLKLNLTPAEEAFKKDILEIYQMREDLVAYLEDTEEREVQIRFSYIPPSSYVKNHPVLLEAYDKMMEKFTNAKPLSERPNFLTHIEPNDDGRAFMLERINKQMESFNEEFERLFNEDRDLLMAKKDKMKIDFYNMSTRVLEEYHQYLEDQSSNAKDEFKKLPKKPKQIEQEQPFIRITTTHLAKMIFLNNKDPEKYTMEFFAKYFGLKEEHIEEFKKMLYSISYLKVELNLTDDEEKKKEDPKQQIIKFIMKE